MSYDYNFKIIVVGENKVGKTCLIDRFVYDSFLENNHVATGKYNK